MLENGTLVYNVSQPSVLSIQFESEVLNVVFSAVLTTFLAYQLSAIFYNVFLGLKPRGRATASDFHKLILSETSSPLSILAAVARNDRVDRLRFKREIPRNVRIVRRETSVTKRVTLSLISLLLVAPLFNLISIFIVLQKDERLTFGDANFPGAALGVTKENISLYDENLICDRVALRLEGAPSAAVSQFFICYELDYSPLADMSGTKVVLSVESTSQGLLKVSATSFPKNISASIGVSLDLATDDKLFRTKPMVEANRVSSLLRDGQSKLAELAEDCPSANETETPFVEEDLSINVVNGTFVVSKEFECNVPSAKTYADIVPHMLYGVGVIDNTGMFEVVPEGDLVSGSTSAPEYFDGSDLPFLVRRTRNASVTLLSIVLVVAVVIRILTSLLFNNDVDEGIEAVVRYRLGTEPYESLLLSSRTVRYDTKRQDGATAHYGLQRSQLPEVESFGDGIEIGLEENTWNARSRRGW